VEFGELFRLADSHHLLPVMIILAVQAEFKFFPTHETVIVFPCQPKPSGAA
jgi:hypothetical protein